MTCPDCQKQMLACEYPYNHPEHYDGISEWECESCKVRFGSWYGKALTVTECEKRFGGK